MRAVLSLIPMFIKALSSWLSSASSTLRIAARKFVKGSVVFITDHPSTKSADKEDAVPHETGFIHFGRFNRSHDMYIAVQINDRTVAQLATDINEYQTWVGPVKARTRYGDLQADLRADITKHPEHRWLILSDMAIAETNRAPVEFHNVKD